MLKHCISWRDIPGWFDYEEVYLEAVNRNQGPAHFVEVGSCWGRSGSFLAWEIKKSRKNIRLDLVDIWNGDDKNIFMWFATRSGLLPYMNPVHMDSLSASACYEDASLDFIFIDADHRYEGVMADLRAWYPKLKPGGLFAGHDYTNQWPGVIRAVREFFPRQGIRSTKSCWLYDNPN